MEGDSVRWCNRGCHANFNPLPPYGGRLDVLMSYADGIKFQSTPSVWRETIRRKIMKKLIVISIHSLRMEGDLTVEHIRSLSAISIHSLRMEGDTDSNL